MTTTIDIPLNKLVAWDGNVRKTGAENGNDELAASIAAHGLLQSLVVRKHSRGKFAVVAGRRRLLALRALAEAGTLQSDAVLSCTVIDADANATEVSLVENAMREQMHPADEFEAFLALTEQGMPIADIAARFGVTGAVVRKRLKLAKVSSVIIDAYRREQLTLEQVMAFAISDDHAAQERVFANLPEWNDDPDAIRDALTEHEISATDKRVGFVTLAAYEEAGGALMRDLFSEGENGVFILDAALLDRLVLQKLESVAAEVRAEGWKWIEIRPSFEYDEWSGCERAYPEDVPISDEQQAELDSLRQELDTLCDVADQDFTDESQHRCDEIGERISELDDGQRIYTQETLSIAGAIVTLGHKGEADIKRGFIRPEDIPQESGDSGDAGEEGAPTDHEAPQTPAFSAALIESLTTHRSAAMTATLMERPDVALAAVVHALASRVLFEHRGDTCLMLSVSQASLRQAEGSKAHLAIERASETWGERIPGNPDALWEWCLAQHRDRLLDLLAFCAARIIEAIRRKSDRPESGRLAHAQQLAASLDLDMNAWFTLTAGNFFSRITKPQILQALHEAKGGIAPAWNGMKKAELASLAERELAGTGWLPEILRPASGDEDLDAAS